MSGPTYHATQQWLFTAYERTKRIKDWPKISLVGSTKSEGQKKATWPEGLSEEELLRWWITENGGYIHPALHLIDSPTCDGRGWVASEEIDYKTVCEEPLIVIPYGLGYFTKDAVAELNKVILKAGSLCTLQELVPKELIETEAPLGIALAAERKKGDQSEFWPHLRLLPAEPESPWYKDYDEQSAICDKLGWPRTRKKELLKKMRKTRRTMSNLVDLFFKLTNIGTHLGLTQEEALWGVSTVEVRKYSSGMQCNLKPAIDFLNHHHEAGGVLRLAPTTKHDFEDRSLLQMVLSSVNTKPKPIAAGEELFILYPSGPGKVTRDEFLERNLMLYGSVMEACPADLIYHKSGGIPTRNLYIDGMAAQSISEQHFKFTLEEKTAFSKKCWDLFKKDPEHPYLVKFWRPNIDSYRKAEAEGTLSEEARARVEPLKCVHPDCPKHAGYGRKQLYCRGCYEPYCSSACQKGHWREHKSVCKALAEARQRS